jgi:hypothetical protein
MRRLLLVLVLLVPLAACGVSYEDRALSAGLMGATLGVGMGAGGRCTWGHDWRRDRHADHL